MLPKNLNRLFIFLLICCCGCAGPQKTVDPKIKQADATRNLGEAYMSKGDFTKALREFIKAERLNPDDPYLQNDLGLAYLAKKKPNKAIYHFERAIKLKQDYTPALNNLGQAYLTKKEWDRAIKIFEEVLEDVLYVTPHYPMVNLGWAYYNKGEYRVAEKYYLESLENQPDFTHALYGLGRCYLKQGRLTEAKSVLERAASLSPQTAEIFFELANAYKLSRDYRNAYLAYQKVVELKPQSAMAQTARQEAARMRRYAQ
jgi:type IV pilus biogenesis/stability protein PilW